MIREILAESAEHPVQSPNYAGAAALIPSHRVELPALVRRVREAESGPPSGGGGRTSPLPRPGVRSGPARLIGPPPPREDRTDPLRLEPVSQVLTRPVSHFSPTSGHCRPGSCRLVPHKSFRICKIHSEVEQPRKTRVRFSARFSLHRSPSWFSLCFSIKERI